MKIIERPDYLARLQRLAGTPEIKIITGVRRAGKSTLLEALLKSFPQKSSVPIYIDFSDLANEFLKDYHTLHDYILKKARRRQKVPLLIDEVQECPNFERAINSLHRSGRFDIYLTGSNAFLLSSDLATLFTGRALEIPVYPFSFAEYRRYHGENPDIEADFDQYFDQGGLAGAYLYTDPADRATYTKELFETILTRDLVQKHHLAEPTVLRHLAEYLMDNISNPTSPHRTSQTLAQNKIATNHVTAANYIEHLRRAYLFYTARRYDIKGKRYLETNEKYYLCDLTFRHAILGRRNLDYGRALENITYLELLRRGYDIYTGKLYQKEIDFVATKGHEKLYIQVSEHIDTPETFARETTPLLQIKDAYPRIILARTHHPTTDYNGIQIHNLPHWLLT